jgi:hypothetical protein
LDFFLSLLFDLLLLEFFFFFLLFDDSLLFELLLELDEELDELSDFLRFLFDLSFGLLRFSLICWISFYCYSM